MHTDFELTLLYTNRAKLKEIMDQLSEEKLLHIPHGFNNNILWQIGHCVVSQQRLMSLRSGLAMYISESDNNNFNIGSSPKSWIGLPDIQEIKN